LQVKSSSNCGTWCEEELTPVDHVSPKRRKPRLSIPFDGSIDVHSVTSQTVFLLRLGDTLQTKGGNRRRLGINQIVFDPTTNTLYVESDELLEQHTRYALIVTNGIRDQEGKPVAASEEFVTFRHDLNFGQTHEHLLKNYRQAMLEALEAARLAGVPESSLVCASVFTTRSVTSTLEKIRDQIHAAGPMPADFRRV
jgi:hypothetical protein